MKLFICKIYTKPHKKISTLFSLLYGFKKEEVLQMVISGETPLLLCKDSTTASKRKTKSFTKYVINVYHFLINKKKRAIYKRHES